MTTESLQPSQGFLPTSSDNFLGTSSDNFLSTDSNPSLLESKMRGVATASDTKKQSLAPSSTTIPFEDRLVIDADTVYNKKTGEKFRMSANMPGVSYNPFEVPHPGHPVDQARLLDQEQALAKEHKLPTNYFPNQAIFDKGIKAKNVFGDVLGVGDVTFNRTGEVDKWGRSIADVTAAGSDQSLLSQMNTPELNADYYTKFNETKKKEDDLRKLVRRIDETKYSVSDANRETFLGGIANAVAGGAVAASDQIYNMTKAPFELGGQLRERGITNKQRELSTALTIKQEAAGKAGTTYTPTAEEQAILETPTQAFMRETVRPVLNGERDITARDLLVGLTNVGPFQQNTHEKLQQSAFIKENITDRLTAYQEGARKIYNSGGSDELFKDSKALYTDSIEPTFVEGVQKIKKGNEVDGVIQVADAIANAGVGIFRVAANNPQAVAEEIVKQIPNSIAASKALLATFLGMYTNTASEVTTSFIKEHGRHPEGAEVDNIQINSAFSAIADSYSDKWIVSKPGVARSVVREGLTESGQSFLEQDAAKQGASKIDFAEVYASGVIGSLAGGGTNVVTNPEAALIEAAQGVGTIAGGAISGVKKAGPTIQWAAQAVGDTAREYGNVLPDGLTEGMSDATKAGLAKLTGALTGVPIDSAGGVLKAAGSLVGSGIAGAGKAVGDLAGQYLDSAFPITSQAVKDFKASNLVPDKITDAVGSTTQAVRDSIGEVNSSTSTPTVDPLQQSAQTQDSVEALKTLLKPENIASATSTPEDHKAFVAEASRHNAELAKEMFAITDPATAPTEENTARAKVLLTEFRKNKDTIDGIKAGNLVADTTDADIVTATTPVTENELPEIVDARSAAVDRTIRSMRQSKEVNSEQLITFEAFKAKAPLTPEQASVAEAFIATQTALATVKKTASVVSNEVIYGQKAEDGKKGYLGMVEHQAIISDALDQSNIPAAQSALVGFKAFAASQVKKVDSLNAIVSAISDSNTEQVKELVTKFAKDFPSFQTLKLGKFEILKILDKPNGLELAKGSEALGKFQGLANSVDKEATMLTTAVAEAELHIKLGSTEAKAVPVKQESGLLTPVANTAPVSVVAPSASQEAADQVLEDRALRLDRLAQEEDDLGSDLGSLYRDRAAEIRAEKSIANAKPAPVVDPITNVVTTDPVTIDTTVDQVTTDTTGNAEEATVTDPVSEVVAASVETTSTNVTKSQPVSSLQAESDKRIDSTYAEYADIMADEVTYPDPYVGHLGVMTALQDRIDKELSSRIAALQISAESKQDLQERYDEIIERNEEPMEYRKSIIEEIRANEKYIAEHQSELFESTAETDTTEVDLLEQIKELAAKKSYGSGEKFLRDLTNTIIKSNSIEGHTAEEIKRVIDFLGAAPDKDTRAFSEQLLDSAKEFITGKTIRDYYLAKVLGKGDKHSVLLTTPNFFTGIFEQGLVTSLNLSSEQQYGLVKLNRFVKDFADTFKEATFDTKFLDSHFSTPEQKKDFILKNPALYFMKEDGREIFDENLVSTLATVAYSWVANNANDLIQHDHEGINRLLGRDSKHRVTDTESKLLSDKQILKSALIHSLGREIVSSLPIQFKIIEDGSIESKMVEALGIYAVMTLEHMGVLAKSEVIHKTVFETMKRGEVVSDEDLKLKATGDNVIYFTGVATVVTPVKGKGYSNTELSKYVQKIVDDNRLSKGLLTELFGYVQQRALPLLVAPTLEDVPKRVKRGIKKVAERVRKALHKYNSNAFTVNLGNHAVLDFLEPEQQLRIFKYNENLEGVHDINKKSVQGTNRTTKNELEAYHQLVEHLKLQKEGMSTAMYFMSTVVSNGRANMEGLINPQASKFFRHMIGMASWESTIDPIASPEKLKLFKIAVAEALGSKVDRQGDETSLEAFDRLSNQPEIRDGVASIKYLNSGAEFSDEEKLAAQEDILAAIEKGGNEMYTLEALTALSTYSEREPFTTRMTKEVDGVTNGVIIGLIQLMGQHPEEMLKFLEAGGISKDTNFVYGEFISKVGSVDNYQRVASTLVEYMGAFRREMAALTEDARLSSEYTKKFTEKGGNTTTLNGIDFFVGDLGEANKLTREARDLAKNPVLITNYGAAMKKVIQSLGEGVLENFYSKLEDASDDQEALDEISKQLNKILKTNHKILKTSYLLDAEDTNENEALKFKLNKRDTEKLQNLVATSIGAAMQHALETHFGTFIEKRKELNSAMTLVHAAFIIKYDAAYKAARDAKGTNLSREERDALVKKLEPSMASFDHAMSDGEMDTELFVAPNESKAATDANGLDPDYRVQVSSNKPLPHLNDKGEGIKSTTARGQVSYYGFPGVRSVILAIHSSDGAVQYKLMETSAVLNVHDADVSGIDGTMAMAQRQNLAFKEVMEDYSMRASIQKTLLRAMGELTPEEVKQVNALLRITNKKAEGFLGTDFVRSVGEGKNRTTEAKYNTIKDFITEFTDTTRIDLAAKKALLASLKSWGQYNLNHGAYIESAESAEMLAAIAELSAALENEEGGHDAMMAEELAHMLKAERDAINRDIKSSATETIDVDTFVADFKPITVSAQTVESIFDQLGKLDPVTDTVTHTEHLRDILNTSIKQVLNPMEILVRKLGKANSGVLAKGKVYLSLGNTSRLHTTDQSAQEVYTHELVHAVTAAALSIDYWLHKRVRSLYEKVQKHITPESFLDYDAQGNVIVPAGSTLDQTIAKAKAVHDHIFDNNDITKIKYKNPITNEIEERQYSNGLLEFVAMGTTNAKFIKILAGINTNRSKKAPMTFADHVYNAFVGAINSVTSLINKTKDPAANAALMVLMHKLANANQVKSNFIMRKLEEQGHLEEIVNSKLYKAVAYTGEKSSKFLKARKNKTLSAVGEMIGLGQDTSFEAYKKVAGKLARKIGITHDSFFAKLVTEAQGITAISAEYLHLLSTRNKFVDQLRRMEAQSLANQILGSFIAGTPSKSEGIGITKVLIKTDLGSLIDNGYTWDKMFGLLKSGSKLKAEISYIEQQLQAAAPNNFGYYKVQAASLGYLMVNGQPLKEGTKLNAGNITHLGGTGLTLEGNLETIENLLDKLASLHAIKYSDAGHVTDFVTVAEREFAADKDNNGVMLSYRAHQDLKARALEQSFEGQKGLMMKGYTKEIYNPRVSIITAPSSMEAELKAQGYIKEREDMSKDPLDLNKELMSLYVNKDGDTATFNAMIVSLTSNRQKGTGQTAGYSSIGELNPALLGSFDAAHVTAENMKIFARADYADLSKLASHNLLVPVENNQHEIVGYRYLMNEFTKDSILQKDNSFAKVLGAMEGSIIDKRESKKVNNKVVNLMRKDFLANYKKDPDLFIKFSPHSQDEKERELYHMLPNDMRREIKKVWKSDVMYVRANMFDAIFGYRKFTVTEGSKEQDEMNDMHKTVLSKFRISLRDKLRTTTAKRGEIALQEIAKEVKDGIVIKLGGTLYNNIISNNLLLWVKGVSRSSIVKDQAMFLDAARQYNKDLAELKELERSVRINPKLQNSANAKARINTLKDHMAVNPIAFLMDSAVSQTIIEDVDTDESQYTYKGLVEERLSKLTSGVPAPLKKLASIAYMTHDTALYKFMREGTQLSDLVARATLHKHNTEKKGMSLVDSINDIKDTFIDYDAPTSKQIQYLNDTNFLMFTKFFLRSQKIIYQTYANAPARALSLLGFEDLFGEMSTINDSNILNTSILGKFNNPVSLMGDLVVPHTASLVDPTSGGGGSYAPQ